MTSNEAAHEGLALDAPAMPPVASGRNSRLACVHPTRSYRLANALWHRRSVRAQLLIAIVAVDIVAALIAGGVTIVRARTATRVEIAASTKLAELMVSEALGLVREDAPTEKILASLPSHLRFLRHVRIAVTDATDQPVASTPGAGDSEAHRNDDRPTAPAWFAALIAGSADRYEVPVIVNGARIGTVHILGEPGDEIAEVWENTVALSIVAFGVSLLVIGILYVIFSRVLEPLAGLAAGLLDLERKNYKVRLPQPRARELAAIIDRFNALAEALEAARAENARLNQRLISVQDDERRHTALELHDEVGPCLFGLKANASSIATAVASLPDKTGQSVRERVSEILGIVEHLQAINRSLLNRLRPMALGHVPVKDLLADAVGDRARQNPHVAFSFSAGKLERSYGDSVDLTVYRCLQESLTNALRHAAAKTISVEFGEAGREENELDEAGSRLELVVRDDGRGIAPGTVKGFGLEGMQERLHALGGRCGVETEVGRGTCVRIEMPVRAAPQLSRPAAGRPLATGSPR
jgi:two-component system, NarL family, sensor histidine kinase UhpB